MSHTKTPWKHSAPYTVSQYTHPLHAGETRVGINATPSDLSQPDVVIGEVRTIKDAELIVKATHAHAALVDALEAVVKADQEYYNAKGKGKEAVAIAIVHRVKAGSLAEHTIAQAVGGLGDEKF